MNNDKDIDKNGPDTQKNIRLPGETKPRKKAHYEAKLHEIQQLYWIHLTAARIIFKKNIEILKDLAIREIHYDSIFSWTQQVSQFYYKTLHNDEILNKMIAFGITREDLESALIKLKELEGNKLWKKQYAEKLYNWMYDMENYFRETYKDEPEKLARLRRDHRAKSRRRSFK